MSFDDPVIDYLRRLHPGSTIINTKSYRWAAVLGDKPNADCQLLYGVGRATSRVVGAYGATLEEKVAWALAFNRTYREAHGMFLAKISDLPGRRVALWSGDDPLKDTLAAWNGFYPDSRDDRIRFMGSFLSEITISQLLNH